MFTIDEDPSLGAIVVRLKGLHRIHEIFTSSKEVEGAAPNPRNFHILEDMSPDRLAGSIYLEDFQNTDYPLRLPPTLESPWIDEC